MTSHASAQDTPDDDLDGSSFDTEPEKDCHACVHDLKCLLRLPNQECNTWMTPVRSVLPPRPPVPCPF